MKFRFIVLETKVMNEAVYVYGGLVPDETMSGVSLSGVSLVDFRWFKLSEVLEKL